MRLRALVCVKAALDPIQDLHVAGSPPAVQAKDQQPVFTIGPADYAAIEAALCLKEKIDAHVTALSLGGQECQNVLRQCLAAGCEGALHLSADGFTPASTWDTAKCAAGEISKRAYDLVLCGDASLDEASGAFGPFLSELLRWPFVSSAGEMAFDEKSGSLIVLRLLEHGDRQRVSCPLPAVMSINALGYVPRYISLARIEETDASAIERLPVTIEARESDLKVVEIGPARLRPRRMAAPGAGLSAAQRMQLMMGRGDRLKPASRDKLFEGGVEAAVERIVQYLQEQGFL
jgi:electron transfer flavoprotein alpha/beta subunit